MAKVLAVLAAVALLLTGCVSTGDPVTGQDRTRISAAIVNAQWDEYLQHYPGTKRPVTPTPQTVTDHDWPLTELNCLHKMGYLGQVVGDSFTFDSFTNESEQQFHLDGYKCTAAFIKVSDVEAKLTDTQLQAYDDFLVNQVQPCLRIAGARTFVPPVGHLTGISTWNPFDYIWLTAKPKEITYLQDRCPPIPDWLNLATP